MNNMAMGSGDDAMKKDKVGWVNDGDSLLQ